MKTRVLSLESDGNALLLLCGAGISPGQLFSGGVWPVPISFDGGAPTEEKCVDLAKSLLKVEEEIPADIAPWVILCTWDAGRGALPITPGPVDIPVSVSEKGLNVSQKGLKAITDGRYPLHIAKLRFRALSSLHSFIKNHEYYKEKNDPSLFWKKPVSFFDHDLGVEILFVEGEDSSAKVNPLAWIIKKGQAYLETPLLTLRHADKQWVTIKRIVTMGPQDSEWQKLAKGEQVLAKELLGDPVYADAVLDPFQRRVLLLDSVIGLATLVHDAHVAGETRKYCISKIQEFLEKACPDDKYLRTLIRTDMSIAELERVVRVELALFMVDEFVNASKEVDASECGDASKEVDASECGNASHDGSYSSWNKAFEALERSDALLVKDYIGHLRDYCYVPPSEEYSDNPEAERFLAHFETTKLERPTPPPRPRHFAQRWHILRHLIREVTNKPVESEESFSFRLKSLEFPIKDADGHLTFPEPKDVHYNVDISPVTSHKAMSDNAIVSFRTQGRVFEVTEQELSTPASPPEKLSTSASPRGRTTRLRNLLGWCKGGDSESNAEPTVRYTP